ncbi:MAG: DsbA family protein [Anaerolineales bacterium]|nr:DsbA family protein [Anaerolineales bacterium]
MTRKIKSFLLLFIGLIFGFLIWGKDDIQAALAKISLMQNSKIENLELTGAPTLGPDEAPVTIIEFGDFECPYCKAWHDDVLPNILEQYGEQVRFIYLDYPLTDIHSQAFLAAEAAHCAGEQGGYWAYHEALFEHQEKLDNDLYAPLAFELGLDVDTFQACLEEGKFAQQVRQSMLTAHDLAFTGTPAFIINGQVLIGAQPFETFEKIITEALGK